jgi:hypothetical protein
LKGREIMAKVNLKNKSVAYFDDDRVPEPGFYVLMGDTDTDENGVTHETNLEPGDRVYPDPGGEGFVDKLPQSEDGDS